MPRPTRPHRLPTCLAAVLCVLLAACGRDADDVGRVADAPAAADDAAVAPAEPVVLEDVLETGEGYIVGISYPRSAAAHPGLAVELAAYADAAREELMQALATPEADGGDPTMPGPYDLSLAFTELPGTPDVVAVAADGSSYVGGAHGQPLVRRFVWLPREGRLLTARALIPDAAGWRAVSDYVQEQLFADASMRDGLAEAPVADAAPASGGAPGTERAMIEAGTAPVPENFDQFEPIPGGGGKLAGLRFVFPPYQVGPYAAGTQTVDVPAAVLRPHLAPAYRALFEPR